MSLAHRDQHLARVTGILLLDRSVRRADTKTPSSMESMLAVSTRVCVCTCAHILSTQRKYKTVVESRATSSKRDCGSSSGRMGRAGARGSHSPLPGLWRKQVGHTPSARFPQLQERGSHSCTLLQRELCVKTTCSFCHLVAFYRLNFC